MIKFQNYSEKKKKEPMKSNERERHTEGGEHVLKILRVDEAVVVVVNHGEGLLELGNLLLVEHGEDIGGLANGALLGLGLASRLQGRKGKKKNIQERKSQEQKDSEQSQKNF